MRVIPGDRMVNGTRAQLQLESIETESEGTLPTVSLCDDDSNLRRVWPLTRLVGTLRVRMTMRCHTFERTTAGDMTTEGTALMTVKLRAENAGDEAVM